LACEPRFAHTIGLRALWLGWLATRAIALCADPGTSDDIWRYVWEGGLVAEGRSPYAAAPADPELLEWRERWPDVYQKMNNTGLSAIYPPAAQSVFVAAVGAAGGPSADSGERAQFALRVCFGLADGLVLHWLVGLLRLRRLSLSRAVVWAWSPLVALEFAGAGHLDSVGIALLVGALAWGARAEAGTPDRPSEPGRGSAELGSTSAIRAGRARRRPWFVALALLALGASVKLIPFFVLPWIARAAGSSGVDPGPGTRRGGRAWLQRQLPERWTCLGIALALLLFGLTFVPLLLLDGGWRGLGTGLGEYGFRWEAASLVYRWIERPLGIWFPYDEGALDPRRLAKYVLGIVWIALAWREWTRRARAEHAAFVLIGAWLVLAPTLHPWYLAWIVPLLAVHPSRAWRTLLVLAPLAYWPLRDWHAEHVWLEPRWLWAVLALPFFGLLAWELLRARGDSVAAIRSESGPSSSFDA
jgi:hypothetical protein